MKNKKLKVVNVVPTMSQQADGVAVFVGKISNGMKEADTCVRVATLDWVPHSKYPENFKIFPLSWGPRRLGRSQQMLDWLKYEVKFDKVDVIHNHGLWMMPNIYSGLACKKSRTKLMISPHGALSSWALNRSYIKKWIFYKSLQQSTLKIATCFHATSEAEYLDIRKMGFSQPICIIPCGVDVSPLDSRTITKRRVLLFLARIHPVKGLNNLLFAWQSVEREFPDWDLHIAGPDNEGYLTEIKLLVNTLGLKRVVFRGPLYGDLKLKAYQDASLYVLPTHTENFGITVAESLAAGTPVIVTKGAPWSKLQVHNAGWWIDIGITPLIDCLKKTMMLSNYDLKAMGINGRKWMEADYSWSIISDQFKSVYNWLDTGVEKPPTVILD